MKFFEKISAEWSLRVGLGVMYIYSGIDILRHPTAWFWAVRPLFRFFPLSAQASFTKPAFMINFLRSQGIAELIFALVLLAWFLPRKYVKWVAGLTALEMAVILFIIPIDAVTFRDFGLLGGGLALFLLLRGNVPTVSASKSSEPEKKVENKANQPVRQAGQPNVQTFDEFIKNG